MFLLFLFENLVRSCEINVIDIISGFQTNLSLTFHLEWLKTHHISFLNITLDKYWLISKNKKRRKTKENTFSNCLFCDLSVLRPKSPFRLCKCIKTIDLINDRTVYGYINSETDLKLWYMCLSIFLVSPSTKSPSFNRIIASNFLKYGLMVFSFFFTELVQEWRRSS